jgi:hypothetical protein
VTGISHWVQISAGTLQGTTGIFGGTGVQGMTGLTLGVDSGHSSIGGLAFFNTTTSIQEAYSDSTVAMGWIQPTRSFVVAADSTFVSPRVNTSSIQAPSALTVTGPTNAAFYCGDVNHLVYGAGMWADTSSVVLQTGVIYSPTYKLDLNHDTSSLTTNAVTTFVKNLTVGDNTDQVLNLVAGDQEVYGVPYTGDAPSNFVGGATYWMGVPDKWITVQVQGATYYMPLYALE